MPFDNLLTKNDKLTEIQSFSNLHLPLSNFLCQFVANKKTILADYYYKSEVRKIEIGLKFGSFVV